MPGFMSGPLALHQVPQLYVTCPGWFFLFFVFFFNKTIVICGLQEYVDEKNSQKNLHTS